MTPKEAYKLLSKYFPNHLCMGLSEGMVVIECEQTIEEALDEHEKQTQILEVMKNKPVHTSWFTFYVTYEQYLEDLDNIDSYVDKKNMLTKEEFYLLKEYFNGK